jgi:hypothetical protein
MPDADIILLCDEKTNENFVENRIQHEKLLTETIVKTAPDNFSHTEISRWIKTSMRKLVRGDFLFIDCDTVICANLSSIFDTDIKLGICLDKHLLLDCHDKKERIIERDKILGFNSYLSGKHYNSGVIYCKDTPEVNHIFERWHELWLYSKSKNINIDQAAFNMAIHEAINSENPFPITELDGSWNCQIAFNGLQYLADSKIIHYFASSMFLYDSAFIPGSNSILSKIKEKGRITDDIFDMLKNPRAAFEEESRIISGMDALELVNSPIFDISLWLIKNKPKIFGLIKRFCSFCIKITRKTVVNNQRREN